LAPLQSILSQTSAARGEPNSDAAASWKDLINKAYNAGIELRTTGWSYINPPASPFTYSSYGIAISRVQIDVLTGETNILSSDILFDCGISLNPIIDIGQCQGAFVQGAGYMLSEDIRFDDNGVLITKNTWEYKPPMSLDIPINFNVHLLKDAPNPSGVLQSKPVVNHLMLWQLEYSLQSERSGCL